MEPLSTKMTAIAAPTAVTQPSDKSMSPSRRSQISAMPKRMNGRRLDEEVGKVARREEDAAAELKVGAENDDADDDRHHAGVTLAIVPEARFEHAHLRFVRSSFSGRERSAMWSTRGAVPFA